MKMFALLIATSLTACNLPAAELPTAQEEGARTPLLYDFECYIGDTRTTHARGMSIPALYNETGQLWELRIDALSPHQSEDIFYYRQRPGEMCGSRAIELPLSATGGPSSTASTQTEE